MFTGKIYKNKLTFAQQENQFNQTNLQSRQIMRVKSQPGIKFGNNKQKIENEQMIDTNFKSHRQPSHQIFQYNLSKTGISKDLLEQTLKNQQQNIGVNEQIQEYDRKLKEHIKKIQSRYQTKLSELQTTLEAKNEIISQLKAVLKEKDKLIQKLSSQNLQLNSSRLNTPRY